MGTTVVLAVEAGPLLVAEAVLVLLGEVGQLLPENSLNSHQVPLIFLFEKFLLFKPATPNKQLASHTPQLSNQTGDYPDQSPS